MVRKTWAKKPLPHPLLISRVISLGLGKTKKLNVFRCVWAERKVILDKVDPKIRRNFERRGWLPLLDVEHPSPVALIKEFYSNLSIHSDDSNIHFVISWIRAE